jgi:hypothetical protein
MRRTRDDLKVSVKCAGPGAAGDPVLGAAMVQEQVHTVAYYDMYEHPAKHAAV